MNKRKNKSRNKICNFFKNLNGFTLVEALICLVIVAVVTAISIPSLVGYVDSAKEKAAVEECRFAVDAAGILAEEHVLETGVVAYSGEAPNNINAAITKSDILKRAELDGKGEIVSFSFNPLDNSSEYKQPTYLVNEDNDVVVSAAAKDMLLAKTVSPFAVSVDTTEYDGAKGIKLTYMEYTASNGITVWYHNDGYGETENHDFSTHIHVMEPHAIQDELTCLTDEKVLFKCKEDGCTYNYVEVTSKAPRHHLIPVDKNKHKCDNVLDAHKIVDGVLVSDKHDCNFTEDHTLSDITTKTVKKDKVLDSVVLDGEYLENQKISQGKYHYHYCTGCGLEFYEKIEEPTEPTTEPTEPTSEHHGGSGNWRDKESSTYEHSEGGVKFYVTGADGGCWNYDMADQNLGPYEAELYLTNSTNSDEYVRSFELTFRVEYEHAWNHDNDEFIELSVGGSTLSSAMYEVVKVDNNTITIKSSDLFTETALDYVHKTSNTLAPGAFYKFQVNFGKDSSGKLIDLEDAGTNFYVENCDVKLIDSYATQIKLNYLGDDISDISKVDYRTWQIEMSDAKGNPVQGGKIDVGSNPISFYVLPGNQGKDTVVEFPIYTPDNPYSPAYTVEIPRREIVANANGVIEIDIPAFDKVPSTTETPTQPTTSTTTTTTTTTPVKYNPSVKLKVVGDEDKTVDIYVSPKNNIQLPELVLSGVKNGDIKEIEGLVDGEEYTIWALSQEGYTFTVNGNEKLDFTYNSLSSGIVYNAKLVKDGAIEIVEPDSDKINFDITYDSDYKDSVNKIIIGYNYPWNTKHEIEVSSDDVVVTDNGFVLVNYKPNMGESWAGITVVLMDNEGNVIDQSSVIDSGTWSNRIGETVSVNIEPTVREYIDLRIIYNGSNYADIGHVVVKNEWGQDFNPNIYKQISTPTSNEIYTFNNIDLNALNTNKIRVQLYNSDWGWIGETVVDMTELEAKIGDTYTVFVG